MTIDKYNKTDQNTSFVIYRKTFQKHYEFPLSHQELFQKQQERQERIAFWEHIDLGDQQE